MKKWTAILLTVISTFSLAACSGGESQEDSGQEPADNAQVSEEERQDKACAGFVCR